MTFPLPRRTGHPGSLGDAHGPCPSPDPFVETTAVGCYDTEVSGASAQGSASVACKSPEASIGH